jgi:hypothetical protein
MLTGAIALVRGARALAGPWARRRPADRSRPAVVAVLALAALSGVLAVRYVVTHRGHPADQGAWVVETGHWIRDQAAGPCSVTTTMGPMLAWYSGCQGFQVATPPAPMFPPGRPGVRAYVVFTSADGMRKSDATLARYRAAVPGAPTATIRGERGGADVYTLAP